MLRAARAEQQRGVCTAGGWRCGGARDACARPGPGLGSAAGKPRRCAAACACRSAHGAVLLPFVVQQEMVIQPRAAVCIMRVRGGRRRCGAHARSKQQDFFFIVIMIITTTASVLSTQ
jgi:hypothetical protein